MQVTFFCIFDRLKIVLHNINFLRVNLQTLNNICTIIYHSSNLVFNHLFIPSLRGSLPRGIIMSKLHRKMAATFFLTYHAHGQVAPTFPSFWYLGKFTHLPILESFMTEKRETLSVTTKSLESPANRASTFNIYIESFKVVQFRPLREGNKRK